VGKIWKIVFSLVMVVWGLLILVLFTLINFPYSAVLKRIDQHLKVEYNLSLAARDVKYHFPLGFVIVDVVLGTQKKDFFVGADHIFIRYRPITFRTMDSLEVRGTGIKLKSPSVNLNRGGVKIQSEVNLKEIIRGRSENATEKLRLNGEGAVFNRITAAGFELQEVRVPVVDITLNRENESYMIQQGIVRSNLFSSQIEGSFSPERVNLRITFVPTRDFYTEYPGISSIISSFLKDERLEFIVKGTPEDPVISVVK